MILMIGFLSLKVVVLGFWRQYNTGNPLCHSTCGIVDANTWEDIVTTDVLTLNFE